MQLTERLSPVAAQAFLEALPSNIKEALLAYSAEIEYPVEVVLEMAIAYGSSKADRNVPRPRLYRVCRLPYRYAQCDERADRNLGSITPQAWDNGARATLVNVESWKWVDGTRCKISLVF